MSIILAMPALIVIKQSVPITFDEDTYDDITECTRTTLDVRLAPKRFKNSNPKYDHLKTFSVIKTQTGILSYSDAATVSHSSSMKLAIGFEFGETVDIDGKSYRVSETHNQNIILEEV